MQIFITESDFEDVLGSTKTKAIVAKKKESVLGPESNMAIVDALPRVIAERVRRMIPPEFELHEITIKVQISGTPFGVGVGGEATIKFGPKTVAN